MHSDSRKLSLAGVLVLLGMLALTVAGCGSSTAGALPPAQQIFRYPLNPASIDVATMDPALTQDFYSFVPVSLVFPGLLTLDANSTPQPWAAQSMPVFDASTDTYTFTVRPGLRWTDGTPIDANTFAYSINRAESPCTASPLTYYLFPIKDAQAFSTETCSSDGVTVKGNIPTLIGDSLLVPNSLTLVIKLAAPAPYFLAAMCYPTTYAQPEQLINKYGLKNWTAHLTENGGFGGASTRSRSGITRAILTWSPTPISGARRPSSTRLSSRSTKTRPQNITPTLRVAWIWGFLQRPSTNRPKSAPTSTRSPSWTPNTSNPPGPPRRSTTCACVKLSIWR